MSRRRYSAAQAEGARQDLLLYLEPDQEVYVATRTLARSGMSRTVTVHVVRDGKLYDVTGMVARAGDYRLSRGTLGGPAIVLQGAGMDMHFHLVYHLGTVLFGNQGGYSLRKVSI